MITVAKTESSQLKANYNRGYVWRISSAAAMGGFRC